MISVEQVRELRKKVSDLADIDLYALTSQLADEDADWESSIQLNIKTTLLPKQIDGTRQRQQEVELLVNGSPPEPLTWTQCLLVSHRLLLATAAFLQDEGSPEDK